MAQLYEFLVDAELQQYYTPLTSTLNFCSVGQIKQSSDEELASIGMTRPEIRRLKKFLKKHGQQGPLTKLKRILTKGSEDFKPPAQDGNSVPGAGSRLSGDAAGNRATLLIKRSACSLNQELGAGEFGTVHYGTWKTDDGNKIQVSLKVVKRAVMNDASERFVERMSAIQRLNHPYLVRTYGVVIEDRETFVISELAPMKSLVDCLRDPGSKAHFTVSSLCDLAVQIADGMNYLESNNFVHHDLAARNVLVFSKDLVKISDHGLTRALDVGLDYYQMNVSISLKLPIAWCAPECIEEKLFTSASDVWSYGVALWEMFSYGFQPWAGFTGTQIASAVGGAEGQRLNQPERCPKEFYDLMMSCWKRRREERPNFAQILKTLPTIKATRHIVNRDCSVARPDCLPYAVGDIFTVLDKSSSISGFWKGIHESSNKTGLFSSADTLPFIESQLSEVPLRKGKVNRKESDRKSLRPGPRLHAGMISGPQNDLRHVGHVGYDGVTFGDVVSLDLPQDGSSAKPLPSEESTSLAANSHSSLIRRSCSNSSLVSDVTSIVTSIISSDTLTDVSSMQEDFDSLPKSDSDEDLKSLQFDGSNNDVGDFRIPDISQDSFSLGSSLMDEVMRVIGSSRSEKLATKPKSKDDGIEELSDSGLSKPPKPVPDDKKPLPMEPLLPAPSSNSPYMNGRCQHNKEESPVRKILYDKLEIVGDAKMNVTESDQGQLKKLDHCNASDTKTDHSITRLSHESQTMISPLKEEEGQCLDHDILRSDARISCRPPIEIERTQRGRDHRRDARLSMLGSHLSDSQSSLKSGILSKIGIALGRRGSTDHKILQSLDALADANSSASTSSEFTFGVRKHSATSSSSLPVQKGAFDSLNGSGSALAIDEDGSSSVIRRTTEKIRSSVASVISKRSSLKSHRLPAPQNLNANTLFFDRLREQEMENAEIEAQNSSQKDEDEEEDGKIPIPTSDDFYSSRTTAASKNNAGDDSSKWSQELCFESSEALHNRSCNASSDSDNACSKKQGTGTTCDSVVSDRCPSVVSQDSMRISECSSLTRRSIDSCYTDDSGAAYADPVSPVTGSDVDAGWSRLSGGQRRLVSAPVVTETDRVDAIRFSEEISSSERVPSLKLVDDNPRSVHDKEIDESIQLVSSVVPGVSLEDYMYALSDTNWDATCAIRLLRLRQRLGSSDSDGCRSALEAFDWDLEMAYKHLTDCNSGRDSPELVHV